MKNIFLKSCYALMLLFLCSTSSFALEVGTHKATNEYIARNTLNGFSLGTYLKNQLGFQNSENEEFNASKVWEIIRDGGEYEDKPAWYLSYVRSLNHFHNPITEEGLKNNCSLNLCLSSTIWMLMPVGLQSPTTLTGNYSWYDVRDYYYKALTSPTKTERDTYFAQTFRGLGQVMHLVQDASVPAHSRDDAHLFYNYETWVGNNVDINNLPNYGTRFFTGTLNNTASFIDTNQYNGGNPSASTSIGLSEYTQANFVSEGLIAANFQNFPYPDINQTTVTERTAPSGNYQRQYYLKNCCGETNNGQGYLLSAVDYLDYYRQQYPSLSVGLPKIPILDNNVYSDYASLLLPRAVGYSAGLLNYFFRGNMDFTIDANDREDGIKGVKISNRFTEDMDGTFSLYYDTSDNIRHPLGSWNMPLASQGTTQVLSFPLPQDNRNKYTLVFRGRMGAEQDAVAGSRAGWREEWDNGLNGLKGNHTWLYTEDFFMVNPLNGETLNEVTGGKLIKENIRYADTGNRLSKQPRINQTLIRDAYYKPTYAKPYCLTDIYDDGRYCFSYDFGEEFPMPVTKDAWISVKIDEISINEPIPYQNCSDGSYGPGGYQAIYMEFDNGITLSFTVPGQEPTIGSGHVAYIEPGKEWSYNIFATFRNAGVEFVEPVNIKSIEIIQQLWYLCEPSTIEHRQRMVVDYFRIEERPMASQSQQ